MWILLRFLVFYIAYASSDQILTNIPHLSTNINEVFPTTNKAEDISQMQPNKSDFDYPYNVADLDEGNEYLDLSVVDGETAKRLLKLAKTNYGNFNETHEKAIGRAGKKSDETFYTVPFFIKKALDLMEQSVYSTRYRLQDTKAVRKRYTNDLCYSMAIFYGSLMQIRLKMDNVYMTMKNFPNQVKFIWFLGLYERSVALNVDVTYMVEAMFKINKLHKTHDLGESVEKGQN